ncbi:MAG: phospho-N-acetylmuramoyl-pentapeptide-transferase [Actinobacteria bacterium]|nr:phospho-N-acetylmuramoyl-pentapeptide-transferase [Actinomycetota bacterium]
MAFAFALVGTPLLMRWLRARGIGQPIREDGPQGHVTKTGTPTMGGIMIVGGALVGYLGAHLQNGAIFTWAGILSVAVIAGAGFVGLLDDWIKVKHSRSLGLNKRTKFAGLITVAVIFAVLCIRLADVSTDLSFTRVDTTGFDFGPGLWSLWAVLLILGSSNAVNLTDGLDGLAAGSSTLSFSAFVVIAFWAFRHQDIYRYPQSLDLALVAAAMMGACAGFLWWNAAPARIFMGDTGSLAIGAGLAALALTTNTQLLLPIIGGLYVAETLSVIVQVASFRLFGRRVFRMAPVHHHFELKGWPETTVIVRFWILSGMSVALAIGIYYADYLSTGATG